MSDDDEVFPEELDGISTQWIGRVTKSGAKLTKNLVKVERDRQRREDEQKKQEEAEEERKKSIWYVFDIVKETAVEWFAKMAPVWTITVLVTVCGSIGGIMMLIWNRFEGFFTKLLGG